MNKIAIIIMVLALLISACVSQTKTEPSYGMEVVYTIRDADLSPFLDKELVTVSPNDSILAHQTGYFSGGQMWTPTRRLRAVIFDSDALAIKAVKSRNRYVYVMKYNKGKSDRNGIENWWYIEEDPASILCVVKGNMVIEIIDVVNKYSEIEDELWSTVSKFLQLVEEPSS